MARDDDLYRRSAAYRLGFDGEHGELKRLREESEALLTAARARAAVLKAQAVEIQALRNLAPPPMPYDAPKRTRGVYSANSPDAIGAALLFAYNAKGHVIARLEVPAMLGANQTLVDALHDWLEEIDPVEYVDPAEAERERVRALLDLDDGGNRPPRGRPRTKRRPLRVVRGDKARHYTPRLS